MKGEISVQTQHIFPVIKKWLYSEKDIYMRELVSNACDAITKHKRLVSLSKAESDGEEYKITVKLSKQDKTVTVSDNGIGMSGEDLDNYINKIALSGALDFIQKYEGEDSKDSSGIIGHFGLGFYSAFMVADEVEIFTKSFDGSDAVHWSCDADGSFEMEKQEKAARGTDIILNMSEDELSYLDIEKMKSILKKYCSFMPYPIFIVSDTNTEPEQINETEPIWQKNQSELTAEDYNSFYKSQFNDYRDPLFYIHINADYPLNFKGVLFFPRPKSNYESVDPQVRLYYNQVFVADNIKEVLPEYLINLKGVIDCPELPLNVSRSYLQTNSYVNKVSAHIAKKFADKLNALFNNERQTLECYWDDCAPYLRYACIREPKFYERIKDMMLFKDTDNMFTTLPEYLGTEELKGNIYYAASASEQAYYIEMFKNAGKKVLLLETVIDTQFTSFIEQKNDGLKFIRVDSDIDSVINSEETEADEALKNIFIKAIGNDKTKLLFRHIPDNDVPAFVNISENSRRIADMMRAYSPEGDSSMFPLEETLVVNLDSPLTKAILSADEDKSLKTAKQAYLLALLASRKLTAQETKELISINVELYK